MRGRKKTEKAIDWAEAERLYHRGLSDNMIAKALNCHQSSVTRWRNNCKYPLNVQGNTVKYDRRKIIALRGKGLTFEAIASALGAPNRGVIINAYAAEMKRRAA